jgi:hypothetical protein
MEGGKLSLCNLNLVVLRYIFLNYKNSIVLKFSTEVFTILY